MYSCESEVQHEKFKNVGQAMWWALATLTTVGCGDVHLVTNASKFVYSYFSHIEDRNFL